MAENDILISFKGADIAGGESVVLYGVDFEVRKGEFVYIIGRVGSGKTSIIKTIIAENRLEKGEGRVCGFDLAKIRPRQVPFLRRKIGIVFQDFQLLMDRTVEDNLDFVLRSTGWKNRKEMDARIEEVLTAVGLTTKAHKKPHQLSGGEQQRVAIARAILNRPELIVADEPTGNLDSETADGILRLLRQISSDNGTAVVIVTHNNSLLEKFPGRVMVCKDEQCLPRE